MASSREVARWRGRAWQAHPAVARISASGAVHRALLDTGDVVAADLGVPHRWGVQATAGDVVPRDDQARTARAWCEERGTAGGWTVSVPERLATARPWRGLRVVDTTGVFATAGPAAAAIPAPVPDGVEIDVRPGHRAVATAYGGWMDDEPLARLLVVPGDLRRPDRRFLVAAVDSRPVGCAFVWWAMGTGYLSGIGVARGLRGRGIGLALTAAAARIAARGPAAGVEPDVVWLHATADGAALYARMGFVRVDTEMLLAPG